MFPQSLLLHSPAWLHGLGQIPSSQRLVLWGGAIPPPHNTNLAGNKWVFQIKQHADGTIECFKALLVAKDYHQQPEVDYT